MHPKHTLALLALLCSAASAMRFTLRETDPSIGLTFQTNGKHTFYAMSSGKEKHDVTVMIDFRGSIVYNQTGTDL